MLRFRQMTALRNVASVNANVRDHVSLVRHLIDRQTCLERRSAALAKWQSLASQAAAFKDRHASGGKGFALG